MRRRGYRLILRITKDVTSTVVSENLLKEQAEKDLFAAVKNVDEKVDYKTFLNQLVAINPTVVKFFDDVLVMDKDEAIKTNRLSLLTLLKNKYNHLTDFAKL